MTEGSFKIKNPTCTNCTKPLSEIGEFCPHCGQKVFDGKVKIKELLLRFFHNITLLDGPLIRMSWQLLVPGKVSTEYFKGRIKAYPHPIQFFFVVMFFFLLMVHKISEKAGDGIKFNVDSGDNRTVIAGGELLDKYANSLFWLNTYQALPDSLKSPAIKRTVDTLANRQIGGLDKLLGYNILDSTAVIDTIPVTFWHNEIKLAVVDVARMSYEDICTHYQITDWREKILVTQFVKSIRDGKGLANAIIGSLSWTIIVMSALMAGLLWLMFRKKRGYYVEHFIFLLHTFSGIFLVMAICLAIHYYLLPFHGIGWVVLNLCIQIGLVTAIYRFYQCSIPRAILGWLMFFFVGSLLFFLIFIFGILVVFMIF